MQKAEHLGSTMSSPWLQEILALRSTLSAVDLRDEPLICSLRQCHAAHDGPWWSQLRISTLSPTCPRWCFFFKLRWKVAGIPLPNMQVRRRSEEG